MAQRIISIKLGKRCDILADSRIRNSLLNAASIFGSTFLYDIGYFFLRAVFVRTLATEYLGVEGLFSNILSVFSLMELGVGPALTVSLYEPIAREDTEKIKSLMSLYRKAYHIIGCCVAVLGIGLLPFLPYLIKTPPEYIPNLTQIYLLFVLNSVLSYFCIYKQSLFIAHQKNYLVTLWYNGARLLMLGIQAVVLFTTQNYIFYLIVQILFTRGGNLFISAKADQYYPYLNEKNIAPLDRQEKHRIFRYAYAAALHGVGSQAVNSTDQIIISAFAGLISGGLYSNYVLVTNALRSFIQKAFSSFNASVGNLLATEDHAYLLTTFYRLLFLNFWLSGFAVIGIVCCIQRFIILWVGSSLLLGMDIVLCLAGVFYLSTMRRTVLSFIDASGTFYNSRFSPLAEAAVNLVASIFLVRRFGTIGVPMGTIISSVAVCFWVEPYVLYKHILKESCWNYFSRVLRSFGLTVAAGLVTYRLCVLIPGEGVLSFIVAVAICCVVPNLIMIAVYHKNEHFLYYKRIALRFLQQRRKKAI